MQSKFIAIGALIGILVGVLLCFVYPDLLIVALNFTRNSNEQLGLPKDYYSLKGSLFTSSLVATPFFAGIAGGLLGFVLYKLYPKKHSGK